MNKEEMKKNVDSTILAARDDILGLAGRLEGRPEGGFQEFQTMKELVARIEALGLSAEVGLARTGVRATVGPRGAPEIVLLADMDALPTRGAADGIMHSCGHHAQMTAMMAVFEALCARGVPEEWGFRVSFVGAPAEEYTQLDFRRELRAKGEIKYLSGKQELIRLGVFDDVACVLKYHSMADSPARAATVNGTLNGFLAKQARFIGKAAHSGAAPDQGINALNAASIALMAIHAQRETFRDDDHIRVHPILKESGITVNTVPDRALIETYVRGATIEAIRNAAAKVDRAIAAGALATGAALELSTTPGYQPFLPSPELGELLAKSASRFIPMNSIDLHDHSYASDDIGDVATLVPACQLGFSGFSGTIHGADFRACDPDRAYILPARILADLVLELGANHGEKAKKIRKAFAPALQKSAYLAYLDDCFTEKTFDFKEWPCTKQ
jgi:amidohydrolase